MAEKPLTLVIFTSMSGHTEALANAIAEGARQMRNTTAEVKRAKDVRPEDIGRASALAFGSPTYFSYMSGELKTLFDEFLPYKDRFQGKPVIAFATGDGGQSKCIESIESILEAFGVDLVHRSDILIAGLAVQGMPDQKAKNQAVEAGKKLADAGVCFACRKATEETGVSIGGETPAMK